MELIFEVVKTIDRSGVGNYPDLIHFPNTQGQFFFIKNGEMVGLPTDKMDYGNWDDVIYQNEYDISIDSNTTNLEIKMLQGWGIVGSYRTGNTHKLIIYEFAREIGEYLNSGTIKHTIDNPISSFTLQLENPDIKDPERPGNIALNEDKGLLNPGGKLRFYFGAGDEEPDFEMGQFFIDRSDFTLANETASADGRNTIGKVLGDQTVDEENEYWNAPISENIKKLFDAAKVERDYYIIENTGEQAWFKLSPNTDFVKALDTMLETLPTWKVKELTDGTIVVGSPEYSGFDRPGIYTFYRNKDIFSRQITRDDAQAYKRVCVHTENFENTVYRDVEAYTGWNLQTNRTLYVQVVSGLRPSALQGYADELALRLKDSGKLESFTGPIRPHLQCGDEAIIIDQNGSKSLGLITEITHKFGKSGFFTDFTVDSGGTVGKGRIADYIKKITSGSAIPKAEAGWGDIDYDEYTNLAITSQVVVSSTRSTALPSRLLNDNLMYIPDDRGWSPATADTNPFIEVIFAKKSVVDAVQLWFGFDDPDTDPIYLPDYYKIEYYNYSTSRWVTLLTVDSATTPIQFKMLHEFDRIETSRMRFTLQPKSGQRWREIQVLGFL